MITRRTKVQLVVFVIITLLGCTYVGARYARLDRVFFDDHYTVVAHYQDSGGIFAGAEVSYRGVTVGEVEKLQVTDDGVDVLLAIDNGWDDIPSDTEAVVGNRSAVGEQYVELQPRTAEGPFLQDGSEIAREDTTTPLPTATLLEDLSTTTSSVDRESLKKVVTEMGLAFDGTGDDLGQIIDTSNSFIQTANDNFEMTTDLIHESNTVLRTQLDTASSIRSFTRDLAKFSGTLAASDPDLRKVIDSGSVTANELRRFIEDNEVDLSSLINNLVTTGEVVVKHLDGVEQILVLYPYVVEGGFSVVSKDPVTHKYDAHFGMVMTDHTLCHRGYEGTDRREPDDGSNRPMKVGTRCSEPPSQSNARGAQNAPRAPAGYRAPVAGYYDPQTQKFTWASGLSGSSTPDSVTPTSEARATGEEAWKWLLLQPLVGTTR
ncbi:MCE family protein [Nocardioides guangzhouensis]|uniref:MCE family protein n=1 Tax=Nocardioides guangzhouensis TaxID=2497878 RepID=A0A4Q4Z7H3_9ACTN|nr:MlaD family protein [Nocardioides guangzhouensis]RYP82934.1 MCE family protein [Nocardioides guangzhouensis]